MNLLPLLSVSSFPRPASWIYRPSASALVTPTRGVDLPPLCERPCYPYRPSASALVTPTGVVNLPPLYARP